jgi:hypothetical protein
LKIYGPIGAESSEDGQIIVGAFGEQHPKGFIFGPDFLVEAR